MLRQACLTLCVPGVLAAQTLGVDQILAKHYEARGGLAKMQAVKSMRVTAKMSGGPAEFPMVIEQKRPAYLRVEINFQGMSMIQAYDGKAGWSINPFASAKKDPEPMTPEELRQVEQQADLDGPLVNWKEKGHKVEAMGRESVEGGDAFKLKLTLKNGDIVYVFLDTDNFLEIKHAAKRKIRDTEVEGESVYGDYKEVGGLMIAHSIEAGAKGMPQRQKITIQKIELNVPLDDARFAMPPKKTETPAPKKDESKK
ncbi:MAG: outer membrane lipoprotein-sorting protein [Acidobacteria bacterium]|nr:outer membrane lipoprotein-sorting protein [Acidobacteriota bacterium]